MEHYTQLHHDYLLICSTQAGVLHRGSEEHESGIKGIGLQGHTLTFLTPAKN